MLRGDILPNKFPKNWVWWVECYCVGSPEHGFHENGYALTRRAAVRRSDKAALKHIQGVHDESPEPRHAYEWTMYVESATATEAAEIDDVLEELGCGMPYGHNECSGGWLIARVRKTTYLDEESQEAALNE